MEATIPTTTPEILARLVIALAIGMLVGLERSLHHRRKRPDGDVEPSTGTRTFGLISVLGALWGLLAELLGSVLLGFAFLAFGALMVTWYVIASARDQDYGITTVVAGLITFVLGAAAMQGYVAVAAAVGVVMAFLLWMKPLVHQWEERIDRHEIMATLKLLLISVVMLPVLPNRGYGPWQALNPYEIWWMVVLIAGISFTGYFAIKLIGPKRGIGVIGLAGGLASSTATTLHLARLARDATEMRTMAAAGILLAAGTMFPRVLLLVGVIHRPLVIELLPAFGVMSAVSFGLAIWLMRRGDTVAASDVGQLTNPFELGPALQFGALLTAIMFLARALEAWMGNAGVYLLAFVSGTSDVDAVTLSVTRMAAGGLAAEVAVAAILIAVIVNTAVKGILAGVVGGATMARTVTSTLIATGTAGAIAAMVTGVRL